MTAATLRFQGSALVMLPITQYALCLIYLIKSKVWSNEE